VSYEKCTLIIHIVQGNRIPNNEWCSFSTNYTCNCSLRTDMRFVL